MQSFSKSLLGTFDDIDHDEIIPGDEELERRVAELAAQKPPPDPALLKVQADEKNDQAKIQLEQAKLQQEVQAAKQKFDSERLLKAMDLKAQEKNIELELDKSIQDETVKLRATRMSERERLQIDMVKEKLKADSAIEAEKLKAENRGEA